MVGVDLRDRSPDGVPELTRQPRGGAATRGKSPGADRDGLREHRRPGTCRLTADSPDSRVFATGDSAGDSAIAGVDSPCRLSRLRRNRAAGLSHRRDGGGRSEFAEAVQRPGPGAAPCCATAFRSGPAGRSWPAPAPARAPMRPGMSAPPTAPCAATAPASAPAPQPPGGAHPVHPLGRGQVCPLADHVGADLDGQRPQRRQHAVGELVEAGEFGLAGLVGDVQPDRDEGQRPRDQAQPHQAHVQHRQHDVQRRKMRIAKSMPIGTDQARPWNEG